MEQKNLEALVTNITLILHNYLVIAKQSGRIMIVLDADRGDVTQCVVTNSMKVDLKGLKSA